MAHLLRPNYLSWVSHGGRQPVASWRYRCQLELVSSEFRFAQRLIRNFNNRIWDWLDNTLSYSQSIKKITDHVGCCQCWIVLKKSLSFKHMAALNIFERTGVESIGIGQWSLHTRARAASTGSEAGRIRRKAASTGSPTARVRVTTHPVRRATRHRHRTTTNTRNPTFMYHILKANKIHVYLDRTGWV